MNEWYKNIINLGTKINEHEVSDQHLRTSSLIEVICIRLTVKDWRGRVTGRQNWTHEIYLVVMVGWAQKQAKVQLRLRLSYFQQNTISFVIRRKYVQSYKISSNSERVGCICLDTGTDQSTSDIILTQRLALTPKFRLLPVHVHRRLNAPSA